MSIKAFFVDALTSALELEIGTPDDVLRHVTPDVLAAHIPRPLWARLLTACLGAPRVDARLVVDTIGIPNLCEHVPYSIIWGCIAEMGARSLGKVADVAIAPARLAPLPAKTVTPAVPAASGSGPARAAVLAPPPEERPAPPPAQPMLRPPGPVIPQPAPIHESLADVISEIEAEDAAEPRLANLRPRSPTAQRFRQSNTSPGRLGSARRPQAAATPAPSSSVRRGQTEIEPEPETAVGPDNGEWRNTPPSGELQVDDSQLVDWQATDGAGANAVDRGHDDDFSDLGRKR